LPIELRPVNRKRLKVVSIEPSGRHIEKVGSIMLKRTAMLRDIARYRREEILGDCRLRFHVKNFINHGATRGKSQKASHGSMKRLAQSGTSVSLPLFAVAGQNELRRMRITTGAIHLMRQVPTTMLLLPDINQISRTLVSSVRNAGESRCHRRTEYFANNVRAQESRYI